MKNFGRMVSFLLFFLCCAVWISPGAMAQDAGAGEMEEELLEESGAMGLYDSLDEETRRLLDSAGISDVSGETDPEGLFHVFSQLLREKLVGPLKALAALTAVVIVCRLAGCFQSSETGEAASFAGALACAALVVTPLLEVMQSARRAVESASVFLLAAVPVYGALMAASGSPATGTAYSFLTLAAGNAIPILASSLVFPLLHAFLALALAASVSQGGIGKLAGSLYGFAKWLLVLSVTVFSGVLSVQTALNARVDAATNKAAKLIASTAVPIVGSAFGDAVAAIQNSVHLVKSGVGAFGILAALCIFAPAAMEAALWTVVCSAGQLVGDIFEVPKISAFLGMCVSVSKMILAVVAATCVVSVVSAAIVLFVRGTL